ncbi:hypothetical protein C8C76_1423 [Halanaerobium saccharolyticum]|uniref:Uncharacterized protein n=1 Tax=Halanaerobium saccharolyticum TaxID=43595 RepID=A0A2T5RG30_9FIRM|nr:hypothetical protein C8C76_1423 [Halanaerobium saccharolyticum]PUU95261.1 MAG: hypothetical protein CI949_261 [Halanaerobium sp.]
MLNKTSIFLAVIVIILAAPVLQAEEFKSPEAFTEYIYANYAEENFEEVFNNFAAELKRIITVEDYLEFQQQNFKKYKLEYQEIEVSAAEEIDFEKIKDKFDYAQDFGDYYQLQVSYLLKFDHFGQREERSEKKVYIRKINADYQLFWDYQSAFNDDQDQTGAGQDE